jgi:hypothetical protein
MKRAYREGKDAVKRGLREVDGHDVTDDIGNAGDDVRREVGNAGDDMRDAAEDERRRQEHERDREGVDITQP